MPRARLLALDLDGTLLRDDKTIAAADARAVRAAIEAGVVVTLATGRLATGTRPIARDLGVTVPIICADGGFLIDPASGTVIERRPMPIGRAEAGLRIFLEHGLTNFVFMHDVIHADESGRQHHRLVHTWTTEITVHPRLETADAWRREGDVAQALGLGSRTQVEAARGALERDPGGGFSIAHFGMGAATPWAVRIQPAGCDKGSALAALAARLGIAREEVAVVGDWLNDLSMFVWAGQSFAMGQAPDALRRAATHTLRATSATGGGVAEALDLWR